MKVRRLFFILYLSLRISFQFRLESSRSRRNNDHDDCDIRQGINNDWSTCRSSRCQVGSRRHCHDKSRSGRRRNGGSRRGFVGSDSRRRRRLHRPAASLWPATKGAFAAGIVKATSAARSPVVPVRYEQPRRPISLIFHCYMWSFARLHRTFVSKAALFGAHQREEE